MSNQQFLPTQQVVATLAERGSQVTTVTFAKTDGTVTTRTGLPRVFKRRVGGEAGRRQAQALRDNGLVFFDYPVLNRVDGKHGFSFRLDRVVAI